ncbi:hypothetical protein Unana1_07503 [Umbelopsis nana]
MAIPHIALSDSNLRNRGSKAKLKRRGDIGSPQAAQGLKTCFNCHQPGCLKAECPNFNQSTPTCTAKATDLATAKISSESAPSVETTEQEEEAKVTAKALSSPAGNNTAVADLRAHNDNVNPTEDISDPSTIISSDEDERLTNVSDESDGGAYLTEPHKDSEDCEQDDMSTEDIDVPSDNE